MVYKKIPYTTSQNVWSHIIPTDDLQQVLDPQLSPAQTIEALFDGAYFIDLSSFIAHALPMRESIWWGALVLELRWLDWNEAERETLNLCKNWVLDPQEAKRRQLEQRIQIHSHENALGWLAQGVFWSGTGSIIAMDQPEVMPAPFLYAKAVAGAINTAAYKPEWQGSLQYYQDARALAEDIAQGGKGIIKVIEEAK